MNEDIRIDISFSNHRKRKKLFSLLGAQGVLSLIDLWIKTAENRPKGILAGMDEADIALDAQWPGNPAQFCQALIDTGFLERSENGIYSIHDWKEHQRYVYFSEERSKVARDAAEKRWKKRRGIKIEDKEKQEHNADIMQGACGQHTNGNAPSPVPSPSPSPIPKKKILFVEDSPEFRLSKLLFSKIAERKPDFKKPNFQAWAKEIRRMIHLDNRKPEAIEKVILWSQNDSFWGNNILSTAKLRKQFDQLELKMQEGQKYI